MRLSTKQILARGFTAHGAGLDRVFRFGKSGFQVRRAPHPTCLWPWYGVRPDGSMVLHPSGRAFQLLKDALEAVQAEAIAFEKAEVAS